jgi:hypothetical protein
MPAHSVVFFEQAGVLNRNVPAAEIDHFGAQPAMNRVQRRGFQGQGRLRH